MWGSSTEKEGHACRNAENGKVANFRTFSTANDPPYSPFKELRKPVPSVGDGSLASDPYRGDEDRVCVRRYAFDGRAGQALKNLLVLCLAFTLLFTAYVSLRGLQSSLNAHRGRLSLACVHAATVVSCLFAPVVIDRLSSKWTLVTASCVFLLYVATNIYPKDSTVVATSILLGLFIGPLWSAQATYLTTLALHYAVVTSQSADTAVAVFNGMFTGFLQSSQVWGNLVSAAVLPSRNDTAVNATIGRLACGALDCGDVIRDSTSTDASYVVMPDTRSVLLVVYVTCLLPAIALLVSLSDSVPDVDSCVELTRKESEEKELPRHLLSATTRMLGDHRMLLLAPLVVFSGLQQGFILGDFTKSYVNCELGIDKIGAVLTCYGAVSSVSAVLVGHLAYYVKRYPTMLCGAFSNVGLLAVVLWWRPCRDDVIMFYVIAGCFGLCDAIWQTEANTLFGIIFSANQEAAFSCFRMLQSAGLAAAFGYSHVLCGYTKVYILTTSLALALVLYSVVEWRCQREKRCSERTAAL